MNIKAVGLVCYIEPDGQYNIVAHYEKINYNKLTIGYITPQKLIPEKVLIQTAKKVATYLYENEVYGYITIDFLVQQSSTNSLKITLSGLKCYYDDFIACHELFALFNQMEKENNQENGNEEEKSAVIFPVIENLGFSLKFDYETFFEKCRKRNIYYDINRNTGTIFVPFDKQSNGCLGMIIIDSDLKQIIKYASKTQSYIGELMSFEGVSNDGDQKKNFVTVNMVADRLYSYQKQFS